MRRTLFGDVDGDDGADGAPRVGRLVIRAQLGAGAMGSVFAAYDPRLDRQVAVKLLRPGSAGTNQRLLAEARALGRLAHPNVVTVFDADEVDGAVHVVMELAPGVTLRAWLAERRGWRELVTVLGQVADGLAAAHRAGLVHRDVKPDNVVIGPDRARLVDFGLAEPSAPEGDARGPTATAGTPRYMAPEVLRGAPADAASDQWSFGVTLDEALGPAADRADVPAWLSAIAEIGRAHV